MPLRLPACTLACCATRGEVYRPAMEVGWLGSNLNPNPKPRCQHSVVHLHPHSCSTCYYQIAHPLCTCRPRLLEPHPLLLHDLSGGGAPAWCRACVKPDCRHYGRPCQVVNCFMNPCEDPSKKCPEGTTCQADYCGKRTKQCKAVRAGQAGRSKGEAWQDWGGMRGEGGLGGCLPCACCITAAAARLLVPTYSQSATP